MMNKGCFEKSMSDSELADILDLYYQLCSLEVTVKSRAWKSKFSFYYVFEQASKVVKYYSIRSKKGATNKVYEFNILKQIRCMNLVFWKFFFESSIAWKSQKCIFIDSFFIFLLHHAGFIEMVFHSATLIMTRCLLPSEVPLRFWISFGYHLPSQCSARHGY